ncbi:hypothetical protein H0W91_01110 [Patescibacteria group bacterium]|nr:hypothetical protein [Patescibacteria group bacterium]
MKLFQNIKSASTSIYHEIICTPLYALISLIFTVLIFLFSVWFPNLSLVGEVVFSHNFTLLGKINFLWSSLGAIATNFSMLSAFLLIIISLLFGLNMAVTIYYFKKRIAFQKANGMSIPGMLSGLIGIGCASCGSVVLSTFLGVGAAASFTGLLPFKGQEFSFLSIIILIVALYITGKKMSDPLVCSI